MKYYFTVWRSCGAVYSKARSDQGNRVSSIKLTEHILVPILIKLHKLISGSIPCTRLPLTPFYTLYLWFHSMHKLLSVSFYAPAHFWFIPCTNSFLVPFHAHTCLWFHSMHKLISGSIQCRTGNIEYSTCMWFYLMAFAYFSSFILVCVCVQIMKAGSTAHLTRQGRLGYTQVIMSRRPRTPTVGHYTGTVTSSDGKKITGSGEGSKHLNSLILP